MRPNRRACAEQQRRRRRHHVTGSDPYAFFNGLTSAELLGQIESLLPGRGEDGYLRVHRGLV